MPSRLPIIPTIIVVAAVLTMIALGIWQLGRMDEKEAMIARYAGVTADMPEVAYPADAATLERNLYRRATIDCATVRGIRGTAGTSERGAKGWAHVADCLTPDDVAVDVVMGFSRSPDSPLWTGSSVTGLIAPGGKIVADPPIGGLTASAKPDPADLPNNHLAYAGQWFFFALTALVIYFLALRRRGAEPTP